MGRSKGFRWWYFLFLLPVALYFGAHRYATYRIDRAITRAGEGEGNALTVESYDLDLIPLGLTARGLQFRQDRPGWRGRGSLRLARIDRVGLFSLLGRDPIEVGALTLEGFDGRLTLDTTGRNTSGGGGPSVLIDSLRLDSVFITLAQGDRRLRLAGLRARGAGLHLPDSLVVDGFDMQLDTAALRGPTTDLTARGIRLAGLTSGRVSRRDVRADTLRIASFWGAVAGAISTGGKKGEAPKINLGLAYLDLPEIDLTAAGDFGQAMYRGALTGDSLTYDSTFASGLVTVRADTLAFTDSTRQLRIAGRTLHLRQRKLIYPFENTPPGPTELTLAALHVRSGERRITADHVNYDSRRATLSAAQTNYRGAWASGAVDSFIASGLNRDAYLTRRTPLMIDRATAVRPTLRIDRADGGRYALRADELSVHELQVTDSMSAHRATLAGGNLQRYGSDGNRDLSILDIYADQYALSLPLRAAKVGETKLRVAEITLRNPRRAVDYVLSGLRYGSRLRRARLDSLQRRNDYPMAETFRRGISRSFITLAVSDIVVEGIRHDPMLRGEAVMADSLSVADLDLDVIENLDSPGPDTGALRKPMPLELLRRPGPRIVLAGARLRSTDISYGIVAKAYDPKIVRFTDGLASIRDLDTRVSRHDSVYVSLEATFERNVPIRAVFALGRGPDGQDYAMRGRMGKYDLSRINPLMRPAAGAIIESGHIEELAYDGLMRNDTLRGSMHLRYDSLNVKVTDGGVAWLKNLLSGLVVKNANPQDGEFRTGKIYHAHDPIRGFFNSYWKGLVSGMRSTALADIVVSEELE